MSGRAPDESMHPSEGARFLFERAEQAVDLSCAAYRAVIFTPEARFEYHVDMDIDGGCQSAARGAPAPTELVQKLDTIAKLIARSAERKRAEELPPWPPRVLRWRGPGRG